MAKKKLMKLCLNLTLNKLYQQLYFIWFTQELDYKAIYTALTALKITSKSSRC